MDLSDPMVVLKKIPLMYNLLNHTQVLKKDRSTGMTKILTTGTKLVVRFQMVVMILTLLSTTAVEQMGTPQIP